MGSVPNCRKQIAVRYPIRWFKCKLKPPKNDKKMTNVKSVEIGTKRHIIGSGKFGVLKKYEDCKV